MSQSNPSLAENFQFLISMLAKPGVIGAVSPSGPALSKAMASFVDPGREGLILEIGPGTGPVTKALIARGVAPERLVLIEYEAEFCDLLAKRYPGVKIVQGDAYALKDTLAGHINGPVAAAVSSLPLLMRPEQDRFGLLTQAFDIMGPDGIFIQFTYGLAVKPMPIYGEEAGGAYVGKGTAPIIFNIPPARVWRYWLTEEAKAARRVVAA